MDSGNRSTNRPPLDWSRFSPPATWKQNGRETRGPCPVTGEGRTKAWAVRDDDKIGCRLCGDGFGKLAGAEFRQHAVALGLIDVDLGAASGKWPEWTWTTTDGRERPQFRTPNGPKVWKKSNPPPDGWPAPGELMYCPAGVPNGPGPVYVTEGASDGDAAVRLGLRAIGRTNARPSAASLARLDRGATYRCWPDVDNDGAGYRQAVSWAAAATAAGLTVEAIDPLALRPDAPPGYDARDWIESLPAGATADTAVAALDAAVVEVEAIRARIPTVPPTGTIDPASMAPVDTGRVPAVLTEIVPHEFVRLCDSERQIADLIADSAAGRLACILEESAWLAWGAAPGWRPVDTAALQAAVTLAGRGNLGHVNKGEISMRPSTGGRSATAAGVLHTLAGLPGILTHTADWDHDPALVGLPSGEILNLATGDIRSPQRTDRIRRRLGAMPATDAEYSRSRFRSVLEHCIPDQDARTFLARRLGAALQDADGLDHLICMNGPGGSGKGSILAAVRCVFGEYESGVPIAELLTGGRRSHSAWKAKLTGCRLLTVDDLPVGRDLDTAVVKELVGGRLNGVQHMGREFFDLILHAPILTAGNAPPSVPGMDSGTERRLVPIQCGPPVANPDPTIRESMRTAAERGACLTWLIEGGIEYRAAGCPVPAAAREAAAEVGRSSPIGEFTAEWVSRHGVDRRLIGEIFGEWQTFMKAAGRPPGGKNRLSSELVAAGWIRSRIQGMSGLAPPVNASEQQPAAIGGASGASGATSYPTPRRSQDDRLGSGTDLAPLAPLTPPCASTGTPADDLPAGALDGFEGAPPPDPPAGILDMPPYPEDDQRQIDSLEAWMRTRGTSWHVANPDPDSPVPGRFAHVIRDPDAPDWARRIAVKMGRRRLAKEWRSKMLDAGLNPNDRPNPWTEES